MNVVRSLASTLPNGTGALADALSDMLDHAQDWFGPRDTGCIVYGIRFGRKYPGVVFPYKPDKKAWVRLSAGALKWALHGDLHYAFWQLAHETVHLLSPTPGRRVNVLEEGLACCFQHDYMRGYPGYDVPSQWMPSYIQAEALGRSLLSFDRDIIKKMRLSEPTIARITDDILCSYCPELLSEDARVLAARFYRDSLFDAMI